MKKMMALLLVMVTMFSFAACSRVVEDSDSGSKKSARTESSAATEKKQEEFLVSDREEMESDVQEEEKEEPEVFELPSNMIDPFAGLSYTVTGVSPYCQIAINNVGCSEKAQEYVTYTLDKERYANGETAIVTAILGETYGMDYKLTETQTEYKLENQPEYITSLDGIDMSFFNQELESYLAAKNAEAVGNTELFGVHAFGNGFTVYRSVENVELQEAYLTSAKKIKENSDITFYNSLNYIYKIHATMYGGSIQGTETYTVYANIAVYNIIKYPDGTLKWGATNPDSYEFTSVGCMEGVDYLVSTCVTVQSANYNITKISE